MARVQLLLCFTMLFASVTLLDVVSAHLKIKPSLPKIEDPKTVKDVEPYTVKVVMVFVSDLEKECPKTNKFKAFFEKLRAYAKYVCPLGNRGNQEYEKDMKAKAGGLFQTIASFAVGKIKQEIREEIQEEKQEAIETFRWMKSLAGRILGGRKKEESEETMKLTAEQQKEIKEGILKWETVIAKIANTMVQTTTTTTTSSSSGEVSTGGKQSQGSKTSGSGGGTTYKDTTGSGSGYKDTTGSGSGSGSDSTMGSPSGSPTTSPSGSTYDAESGSGTSYKDTSGGSPMSPSGSPKSSQSSDEISTKRTTGSTTSASGESESESLGANSQATTVQEVEAETSKEVMTFIMNLEKKCPQKEEYKSFFEKLKGTMTASAKVTIEKKKGLFSGLKSAAGKVSDAMSFMRARIGGKSAEVKKSMETYHAEVVKAVQELDAIHSKILAQNQGKKETTVTAAQRTEIKLTITKWEKVTTQFVESCVQSETSTNSSAGLDKTKLT